MKVPVRDHNVTLPMVPDMGLVKSELSGVVPEPDIYLWIESVPGYLPSNLQALKCPKACYLIDSHLNLEWHVKWAQNFDFVFIAQREYVPEFQRSGCRNVFWLPLACDPEIHSHETVPKRYDVGFVGSIFKGSRRAMLINKLLEKRLFVGVKRCFWDEMAALFAESRIVFNNAARNDLNMRVFEAMSTGSFLLTDPALNSGQNELFVDGEDFGVYQDENLVERARYYLVHEEEREHAAARGRHLVRQAHTYGHRCEELINVCQGRARGTPTAQEWRERSLLGLTLASRWVPTTPEKPDGRSFVIPVLDASAEGRAEFNSLLKDLEGVEGEVIVVFNSAEAAAAFKDHPRIDLSATMNVNVGVSRAWNIGVQMASQPTVIFANADLRLDSKSVETLESALWTLPSAGIVGPEGSFFGFYTYEDILWLHEGKATSTLAVDAVSGFFFAVKRELFTRKILQFETAYTPCFAEEWDIGLQARQNGYRCYVVPVKGYEHKWGISKDMNRVVRFMKNQQATASEILARNRIYFWRKWLKITGELKAQKTEPNTAAPNPPTGPVLLRSRMAEMTELSGRKS